MIDLLKWYDNIPTKTIKDIIEFHVKFEKIHHFQDKNKSLVKNKLVFSN